MNNPKEFNSNKQTRPPDHLGILKAKEVSSIYIYYPTNESSDFNIDSLSHNIGNVHNYT